MKLKNSIVSIFAALSIFVQAAVSAVPAAAEDELRFGSVFDNEVTNSVPQGFSVSGGNCKVVDDGNNNKSCLIEGNNAETVLRGSVGDFSKKLVIKMSLKIDEGDPELTIGLSATASDTNDNILAKLVNKTLYTSEGRKLCTINNNTYTSLAFVLYSGELYDIYVNGKMIQTKWRLTKTTKSGYVTVRKSTDESSSIFIDDFMAYSGDDVNADIYLGGYSSERIDKLYTTNEAGDDVFFDSRYLWTSGDPHYLNFTAVPKTNTIECARYDYTNPERQTYIYLDRSDTSNDVYFDIAFNRFEYTKNLDKKFNYYLIDGDFKVEKLGAQTHFLMRDSTSSSTQVQSWPVEILPDGSLYFNNGRTIPNVAVKGSWFNLKLAVDMITKTIDCYVNGKCEVEDLPLPENFESMDMLRISLYAGGKGDLYVDNLIVRGLINPVIDGEYEPTCIYPDDSIVEDFLADKVGLHSYSGLIYANGKKSKITGEPERDVEANEYFIPIDAVNEAFGTDFKFADGEISGTTARISADGTITKDGITDKLVNAVREKNGTAYVGICEFAQKVLGKSVLHFETGMILISDKELFMETDSWEYFSFRGDTSDISIWNDIDFLNAFLQYERPDAQRLIDDMKKKDPEMNSHPRVYMTASDFELQREKYKTDEQFKKIADAVIEKADQMLDSEGFSYKYDDAMRMLNTATAVWENFTLWGYAYNMTGDQKYLDRVYKELQALDKFPDFNTSHIIDTGFFASGLAIAYDWFYNGFNDEQRELAKRVCFDKCFKTLASIHYGQISSASSGSKGWGSAKGGSNYNGMINGGIISCAIATMECDPEFCADALSNSIRSIEYILQNLMPGGGWSEGVSYWQYGLQFIMSSIVSLQNVFGQDYALSKTMGMESTLNFAVNAMGAQGINNFHDASSGVVHSYQIFTTISKMLKDPVAFKIRMDDLESFSRVEKEDAIFYDFEVGEKAATADIELPSAIKTDGVELFSIRDSYDPAESDFYFSTHFGITSGYHTHNDTGTFVLDMIGERWAEDLGAENYNLQNELGYKDADLYRKRAEGHNVMVLNPNTAFNQTEDMFVPITDYASNDNGGYVVADMSGVYKDTSKMKLGYYIDDNMNSLTMRNEFTVTKQTTGYWFMHTKADIYIEGDKAILSKNGKSVQLEFDTDAADAEITVMDAKPLQSSPQVPEQNANDGYRKVAIKFTAKGDTYLTVKVSPLGMDISPIKTEPIDEWTLPEHREMATADISFDVLYNGEPVSAALPVYDEVMPELTVVTSDPSSIVEVDYAANSSEQTVVTVWDKTKTFRNVMIISYFRASGKSMLMYNTIPVQSVEVSSEPEPANRKENMLDSDFTTRWTCMAKGEWAVFDLGEVKDVAGAAIAFWYGAERNYYFDLYASEDGITYTQVYADGTSSGESEALEVYDFDSTIKARYIKFVGRGNSVNTVSNVNSNILEFRVLENKY